MNILVWGLGYVGTVTGSCLADRGHYITGIDISQEKVDLIKSGKAPIREAGLDRLINRVVSSGHFRVLTFVPEDFMESDISLICVGTPSEKDGSTNLGFVKDVAEDIGNYLRRINNYHVVALRSTVPPGTSRDILIPRIEDVSGKTAGTDFDVVMNPEFLREGSAIADYNDPPYTIIGLNSDMAYKAMDAMYKNIEAPLITTSLEEAELLKMVNNSFHSLKIGFSNEIARISKKYNINSLRIMDLVCEDTRLNISPAYLRPGFAFGGSCLPKDLRSLNRLSKQSGLQTPILDSILQSNRLHIHSMVEQILGLNIKTITIVGITFKPGTDDVRESPSIPLISKLEKGGLDVRIYDDDLRLDSLIGANKEYLSNQIPNFQKIFYGNLKEALKNSEAVILTKLKQDYAGIITETNPEMKIFGILDPSEDKIARSFTNYISLV
jgi:GDP-mannose 6-dehydrogenase